jgi:hypothetical protein
VGVIFYLSNNFCNAASAFIHIFISILYNELAVLEFLLTEYRCEENATTRDGLYVAERKEHDETKQALLKAQERNWELLRKVDDSEKTINKMLENAQRFLSCFYYLDSWALFTEA